MTGAAAPLLRVAWVDSTMDAVHELAEAGARSGTAMVADEQAAGRGSRGRTWTSPRGGLWLSVLARPATARLELLSLRAGLAVAEQLERVGAGGIGLKWPNDLMLGERKVGGILCEARWQGGALAWVVMGVGLNVSNPPARALADIATHLASIAPSLSPAALAEPIVGALRTVEAVAGPLTRSEAARFSRRDWLFGRPVEAPQAGVAKGIDVDGALLVRRADGTTAAVRAGTVVLAATSASADLPPCS